MKRDHVGGQGQGRALGSVQRRRDQGSPAVALQQRVGNAAFSRAVTVQRLWNRDGKQLRPFSVGGGEGKHGNLKFNKGRSATGKKTFNTGFWAVVGDIQDQLHVHMGDKGGLTSSGGAHHFKRGSVYGANASESDLEKVFGSKNVNDWTADRYTIPAG